MKKLAILILLAACNSPVPSPPGLGPVDTGKPVMLRDTVDKLRLTRVKDSIAFREALEAMKRDYTAQLSTSATASLSTHELYQDKQLSTLTAGYKIEHAKNLSDSIALFGINKTSTDLQRQLNSVSDATVKSVLDQGKVNTRLAFVVDSINKRFIYTYDSLGVGLDTSQFGIQGKTAYLKVLQSIFSRLTALEQKK